MESGDGVWLVDACDEDRMLFDELAYTGDSERGVLRLPCEPLRSGVARALGLDDWEGSNERERDN